MYPVRLPIKSPWLCIFNDTIGAKILKAFLNKLRISREEKNSSANNKCEWDCIFCQQKNTLDTRRQYNKKLRGFFRAAFLCSLCENPDTTFGFSVFDLALISRQKTLLSTLLDLLIRNNKWYFFFTAFNFTLYSTSDSITKYHFWQMSLSAKLDRALRSDTTLILCF